MSSTASNVLNVLPYQWTAKKSTRRPRFFAPLMNPFIQAEMWAGLEVAGDPKPQPGVLEQRPQLQRPGDRDMRLGLEVGLVKAEQVLCRAGGRFE